MPATLYLLPARYAGVIAVPQLLNLETNALKWHFPQENATLQYARKGT
jgi:hypothetical protein